MLNNTNYNLFWYVVLMSNIEQYKFCCLIELYVLDYEKGNAYMNYYFGLCKREKIILLTLEMVCYCLIGSLLKHFEH